MPMKVLNNIHCRFALCAILSIAFSSCTKPERVLDLQGHRGARGLSPENTIKGFQKALEYPLLSSLELDVCISKDGQVLLSHEPWMNAEICGVDSGLIAVNSMAYNLYEMTLDSIQSYNCGSYGHPSFPEQVPHPSYKPSLKQLFEYLSSRNLPWPNLNIETKSKRSTDNKFHPSPHKFASILAAELVQANETYPEADLLNKVTVQSFDSRTLREFLKMHIGVKLCLLAEHDGDAQAQMDKMGFPVDIYSPEHSLVTRELLNWCHFRGIRVIPWTVNDLARMQELIDMGVDGLISDYPNKFSLLVY